MKPMLYILLLLPGMAWATTYKCVDAVGKVTYSTNPCSRDAQAMHFPGEPAGSGERKLVVHMDASRSYRTAGSVNGLSVTFVIDTGASRTTLSSRVAIAAGIKECIGAGVTATANGFVQACVARIDDLTFGDFHFHNLMVSILPQMPVDALLGMDVLGQMRVHQEYEVLSITNQ